MKNAREDGLYSEYDTNIPDDIKAMFNEVTQRLMGVGYKPICFAIKREKGFKFKFFCNATPMLPGEYEYAVFIEIFKPTDGIAHLIGISRVN
ncbi:hypothetical protein K4L44_03010 [Halosquirtibacter laminarini]|uniref:Uncharacterized protein n=1 Tax=Halosquirtibacter laminarini TaxID=3374600 RepID=A0AC61NGT5_9BACT|nr:hypothetical protein K4L44_03010 [Prolixibacteraceae bacterium]